MMQRMTTETVTILFCDLVASTERRARLGDDAFDAFTARFMQMLRGTITQWGGREVSSAGDGLMVVFRESVADSIECATEMHRAVRDLDADDPPRLRIGVSTGEVAQDGTDYSGMPIVEAARLEAAAAPGQTLANAVVRALVGNRRSLHFRDIGALTLKGIPEPLPTVAVVGEDAPDGPVAPHPAAVATLPKKRRAHARSLIVAAVLLVAVAVVVGVVTLHDDATGGARKAIQSPPTAGVPTPQGYKPTYSPTPCPTDVKNAAADATCGTLVVPQDRTKADGPDVSLLVSRAPPRQPGGTGAPTIDICGCEDVGNSLARDRAELIHIGLRGYEGTPSLTCPEFVDARRTALAQRSDDPAANASISAAFRRCYNRLEREGIDPSQYNLNAAAADVLDLMWVLGIKQANFVAFGDLGAEALVILRRAPGAVRSLTLENPAPPGETRFTNPTRDLAGAFRRLDALCRADHACAAAYPNLESSVSKYYAAYQAKPQLVSTPDPNDEQAPHIQLLLDGPRLADALADGLGRTSSLAAVPSGIMTADADLLASLVVGDDRLADDAPWGAQASYYCSYPVHTEDPQGRELAAKTLPEFVRSHDMHWSEWCKGWDTSDASESLGRDVVSDVPVLAFRGDLTPDGNSDWLRTIERGFSTMHSAVFPTFSSGLLVEGPPCLSALRRAFLVDPTAPIDTVSCVKQSQSPPIDFVTPTG